MTKMKIEFELPITQKREAMVTCGFTEWDLLPNCKHNNFLIKFSWKMQLRSNIIHFKIRILDAQKQSSPITTLRFRTHGFQSDAT